MALDKDFTQRFTVIRPLNLNNIPDIQVNKNPHSQQFFSRKFYGIMFLFLFFFGVPIKKQSVTSASNEFNCCSLLCCCCCILMRPIEVMAKIPVTGYTPGQMINLELHIKHKGSEKLYEFTVHLMKVNAIFPKRLDFESILNHFFHFFL